LNAIAADQLLPMLAGYGISTSARVRIRRSGSTFLLSACGEPPGAPRRPAGATKPDAATIPAPMISPHILFIMAYHHI